LNEDLLTMVLDTAQKLGAEYAEARLHVTRGTGCMLRNGVLEPPVLQDARGIGIRIVHFCHIQGKKMGKVVGGQYPKSMSCDAR